MRPGRKLYARHTMRLTLIPRFPYGYFRDLLQRYRQTSEKLRSLLLYFSQRVQGIFAIYRKDTDKRARNFEACFYIFHSECRVFSRFIAKIVKNE